MACRLDRTKNDLITKILDHTATQTWHKSNKQLMTELKINEDIENSGPYTQKKIIKEAINVEFIGRITEGGINKSKIQHLLQGKDSWAPGKVPTYMNELTRTETSNIFKARTRMIDVKNNFRGKYQNIICRGCKRADETQSHVLEICPAIHKNDNNKVTEDQYFSEDLEILKRTAKNLKLIQEWIGQSDEPPGPLDQRAQPGTRVYTRLTN